MWHCLHDPAQTQSVDHCMVKQCMYAGLCARVLLLARTHIVSSEGDRLGAGAAFLPTETMFACATAGVTAGCAAACDARLAGLGSATGCCRHRRGSNGVTLVRYGNTARARTRMVTYAYRAPWQNEHTIHGERRARQRKGDVMCVGLMMMMLGMSQRRDASCIRQTTS